MNLTLHFLLLPIFLIFSALFSGSESAIFSLTEYEKSKIRARAPLTHRKLKKLLDKPTNTIAMIITGNTIVNTVATSILGLLIYYFYPNATLIFSIFFVSAIILLAGEVFPKLLALRFANRFSLFSTYFLTFTFKLISPLEKALSYSATKFASVLGINVGAIESKPALSELYAIVKTCEEKGILEKDERILAEKVLDSARRWVKEIMTPRIDIVGCSIDFKIEEVIEIIKSTLHTKYPVYKNNLDDIIGVLYSRNLIFRSYNRWHNLIQPLLVVPEYMKIDELLLQFRDRNEEIALVIDEFGGTAGIVTLEDILEELVGEIEDEYKREKDKIRMIDSATYSVRGDVPLKELSEVLNVDLKTQGITTLAGLLLYLFQKVPSSGQSLEYRELKFFIDEVHKNKIVKVTIEKGQS